MNSGDLQLMNRDQGDGMNLAVGEPRFLQDGWNQSVSVPVVVEEEDLRYPNPEGSQALLEELGWMYPGKFIVVTNGAKGGLMAAIHALRAETWDVQTLNKYYWPTHPTLVELNGSVFRTEGDLLPWAAKLLTSPNNPDGKQSLQKTDIWDAAYASQVYGWDGALPEHRISIWSAAKMLGFSGARVGWIVTGDRALYNAIRYYLEKTSSGVSRISQKFVARFLRVQRQYPQIRELYVQAGRRTLVQNATRLLENIGHTFTAFEGAPLSGMYIWAQLRDREKFDLAAKKAGVHVLDGSTCGATNEFVRISCGQTQAINDQAATDLRAAYDSL